MLPFFIGGAILTMASIAYSTASEGALDAKPAAVKRSKNVK